MATVIPFGVGTSTVLQSDPLTHTDPPVELTTYSTNWTLQPSTTSFPVGSAGARPGTSTPARSGALYNATFPADQWAQCTMGQMSASVYAGLIVRGDALSGGNGYYLLVTATSYTLNSITNGAVTILANVTSATYAAGDVWKLSVAGSLIIVERNGNVIWQVTSTAHTAGAAGICGTPSGAAVTAINTWSAGGFTYTPATPGFVPFPLVVSIAGTTNNTWKTITIPTDPQGAIGVPPNVTTGVMLLWTYTGTGTTLATRITGSTDTQLPPTANAIATNTQGIVITGVSLSGTPQVASFDINLSVVSGIGIYLIGYFGAVAPFFTAAHPITVPSGDISTTPASIDLSATVGNAAAVFGDLWGNACRIAPHGDADILNWLPTGLTQKSFISGTTNGVIDVTAASGTTPTFYLRGYMTRGFAWRTPAFDVSPTVAASYQPVAAAPSYPAGTKTGMLYQARSASTNFSLAPPYSTTGYNPAKPPQSGDTLTVGAGPTPQILAASLPFTLAEQGYFVSVAVAATGPPTSVRSLFAVRTTSQT